MLRFILPLLSVALLAPLAACGGGGGIVLGVTNDQIAATADRTGYIIHDGVIVTDVNNGPGVSLVVGDNALGRRARAFTSFDLSFLPIGAEVLSAELVMNQNTIAGAPYIHLGNMMVDHVNLGAALTAADYAIGNNYALNVAVLAANPILEVKSADVTNEVRDDLDNGRTRSEFRMRFVVPTANPGSADFAILDGVDDPVDPQLRITWN